MLTYSPIALKPKRKDRPWLLFIMVLIWIGGATFFHSPWEPYEPYVVAIVKSIVKTDSWLVPYISPGTPYLELQPFYFWLYALAIKIFNFTDVANAIRLMNTGIILLTLYVLGKIGSGLSAFKNGRSVVMIMISTIGFINNAYQLSPNIIILLGFSLYFWSLQNSIKMPGISGGVLAVGLMLISINFTAEYLLIALIMLVLLPIIDRQWKQSAYFLTLITGFAIFAMIFGSYGWQLNKVNHKFFIEWVSKYSQIANFDSSVFANIVFYFQTLLWYLIPGWILALWTLYKRRGQILKDPILKLSLVFIGLLFFFAIISGHHDESVIFPIIIPFVFIASVEIDTIRISIVSLLNWFSIFAFGAGGLAVIILYFTLNSGYPKDLLAKAQFYAPTYVFDFNFWQVLLAVLITAIWIFMVTRKHIRGREMVSNWASGTTFCLVLFISLCLPWFNSVLSFKDIVDSSRPYLDHSKDSCIATNEVNRVQSAIWYYFADIRLQPDRDFASNSKCKQALISVYSDSRTSYPGWHIIWSNKRPIDFKRYMLLERN